MEHQPPKLIAIDHDDYHASHVGRTHNGHQFFLTAPFIGAVGGDDSGREFIALYLFDLQGTLLEAHIDDLGARVALDDEHYKRVFQERLLELGEVEYCRILVQPFQFQRFGTMFGLVTHPPEEGINDYWCVTIEPGNYMAFYEPWDSGDYDT